jgi:pimeloyl-ACP methyl ester carboxylesterase
VTEDRVRFYSDGIPMSAVLVVDELTPATSRPAFVYSHGWGGAVNAGALPLVRSLAGVGYVGLAIDHRGFAHSGGTRARCDPNEQARDVSNAVDYLLARPDVDPDRVIVVGASFGGAIAVLSAARDRRLAAAVVLVGVGDGERWLRGVHGDEAWPTLLERLRADAVTRATTGRGELVSFSTLLPGPDGPSAPDLDPIASMYPHGYPLENLELAIACRPEDQIAAISPRPVVLIGVDDDSVVPIDETVALHQRAMEPKRLIRFPTGDHGGPLGPHADEVARAIVELVSELGAPA